MTVFTVAYANKTLPLVSAIVADILAEGAALRRFVAVNGEASDSHDEYHRRNRILHAYVEELEELGCIYADYSFSVGTVHFPALINDREVFMNWQYGEDVIRYYHGVREQPAARREIPVELFSGSDAAALQHAHSSAASA
jgi:hypothetical protein